ncbi:MAG: hypothetical protein Q4B84_00350 [Clostridia bacterium]|nr:hypothetical protein [Clostridia bacterium]
MKNNSILKNFKKPIAVSLAIANLFTFAPSSSAAIPEFSSEGKIILQNRTKITKDTLQLAKKDFSELYNGFVKQYTSTKNSSDVLDELVKFLYNEEYFVTGISHTDENENKKSLFVCCKSKKAEHICFLFALNDAAEHFQLFLKGGQSGYEKDQNNSNLFAKSIDYNILRPDFFNGLVTKNDLVLVISSEDFWNQAHEALSVKELKDYSGTDYKGQKHNQYQNVKANNFLQFVTTEKIGSEDFDFVLDIKPNNNNNNTFNDNNSNNNNTQQQPKPQQNNNIDPELQQNNYTFNNNNNKKEKKKSYLKPILIGCCGILAACLISIPFIGPIIKQHIKNGKTKVNINK